MASETTIDALKRRIDELKFKKSEMKKWMLEKRKASITEYRLYKFAKADCLELDKRIRSIKDDLKALAKDDFEED